MKNYVLRNSLTLAAIMFMSCNAALAQSETTGDLTLPKEAAVDVSKFSMDLANLPFVQVGPRNQLSARMPGEFHEVVREARTGVETDGLALIPTARVEPGGRDEIAGERVPRIGDMKGNSEFEFFHLKSGRHFSWVVDRADLAKFSRQKSKLPNESDPIGGRVPSKDIKDEERTKKSWSDSTDNRSRRAIADGFPDNHSIYQRVADYGGCSATVLSANQERMIAITAAHCIFLSKGRYSKSWLWPRANGVVSPTFGSWEAYAFGYYKSYLDRDCDVKPKNWNSDKCIKHDIALVFAKPHVGVTTLPLSMGWGYQSKSTLKDRRKYRRGYPGCLDVHSPKNCTSDNLYGDGKLDVGRFRKLDGDLWNRQFRFSSDVNHGDSGSGLYYFRNGYPYVFGVASAESDCKKNCSSSKPNFGRRITPSFFDFINSVM